MNRPGALARYALVASVGGGAPEMERAPRVGDWSDGVPRWPTRTLEPVGFGGANRALNAGSGAPTRALLSEDSNEGMPMSFR